MIWRRSRLSHALAESTKSWIVDTGATKHMTGMQAWFLEIREPSRPMVVVLGDNSELKVAGLGTVTIQTENGESLKLEEVLHVPGLKKNLLSFTQAVDSGVQINILQGDMKLQAPGSEAIMTAKR